MPLFSVCMDDGRAEQMSITVKGIKLCKKRLIGDGRRCETRGLVSHLVENDTERCKETKMGDETGTFCARCVDLVRRLCCLQDLVGAENLAPRKPASVHDWGVISWLDLSWASVYEVAMRDVAQLLWSCAS